MAVTFHDISFAEARRLASETAPLFEDHRREAEGDLGIDAVNPDEALYAELDRQGKLVVVGAADEGKPIGYIVFVVSHHPHYKHIKYAADDMHYLLPQYRALYGFRLLQEGEAAVRKRGCQFMTLRTKVKHDHGRLFERLGCEPLETVYIKRLVGEPRDGV